MDILQDTLDHLDIGIIRFDADLKLVAWNRALIEMMGFPPELMRPGTPFLAIVEFNIARGEHGVGERRLIVRQRLASLTDSYARRRPDGTLIRIQGHAMPDGGIMKVFTRTAENGATDGPPPALSGREREVLLWAAQGKTAWETSAILGISPKTVEFHLANCGRKLGTTAKAQTILAAARRGLLPL
jgi:DNA-binding CsgD family transcriptional regulator